MVTAKATEANIKALVEQKAVEIEGLTKKYNAAVREAGPLDLKIACGTCGKKITEQDIESNDGQRKYFSCAKCSTYQCVEHTTDITQCIVCNDMYCEHCLPDEHCSGCMNVPLLTCCSLTTMSCGQRECSDCRDGHHKYCSCERGGVPRAA